MGLDPATLGLMAAMMGSSAVGSIFAPEGQELDSFEGEPGIDPRVIMGETKGMMGDYISSLIDRANEDVTVRTTVKNLPSFVGGALPMAISAVGSDDNRMNPALRVNKNNSPIPKRSLTEQYGAGSPGGGQGGEGGVWDVEPGQPPRRRMTYGSAPAASAAPPGGGDEQALAALDVLMAQADGSSRRTY